MKCHKKTPRVPILNKQKHPFFFFFFFTKSGNRRVVQVLPEGVDTSRRGEEVGKGCRRVNMVQILCTYVCKWKNDTWLKLFQEWGRGLVKGEWWMG
jgi:hypothetical protein